MRGSELEIFSYNVRMYVRTCLVVLRNVDHIAVSGWSLQHKDIMRFSTLEIRDARAASYIQSRTVCVVDILISQFHSLQAMKMNEWVGLGTRLRYESWFSELDIEWLSNSDCSQHFETQTCHSQACDQATHTHAQHEARYGYACYS